MIGSDHVVDKTAAYALHALPEDEARAVELHCARCAACQADLAEMVNLAATLPLACATETPSPALRRRILDEARADLHAGQRLRAVRRPPVDVATRWAAAAAAVALLSAGIGADSLIERQRMAAQMEAMRLEVAADQQTLDDIAGASRIWDMSGGTRDHWWHCTLVQPLHGRPATLMAQMPAAPKGMAFQAWVIHRGVVHDAGMVPAGVKSTMRLPMPVSSGDIVAFSIEPAGGSTRPTGRFAMQSTLD